MPAAQPMQSRPEARPGNWLLLLLGALVAFGPLSIDMYLPALPAVAASLSASPSAVQMSVTVFLAGFTAGMLFYGPISDHYGRRTMILPGIALFVVASLACMLATNVGCLVVARFLQALGGGAASVLARAVVRDLYASDEVMSKLSLMAAVSSIAPLLAPLVGSFLLEWAGWREIFGMLLAWGGVCWLAVYRFLPGTPRPPVRRRLASAFAAYAHILRTRRAAALLLAGGASFAAMFAYITASPFVFIELRGFTPLQYGSLFALNAGGLLAVNLINSALVHRVGPTKMMAAGAGLGLAGALVLAVSVAFESSVPVLLVALFLVVSVTGMQGANCTGLLMQIFPRNAGAAAAMFGAFQFGLGMFASGGVSLLHDGTERPMATAILSAAIASAFGCAAYAHVSRRKNKRETSCGSCE